jgi:SAM-dependent methyltransferase
MPNAQPSCPICLAVLEGSGLTAPDRLHGTPGEHTVVRCATCGAGVTLPRVGEEELGAFYPDEYGPYDDRMGRAARLLSRIVRALEGWWALRTTPLAALRVRPPGRGVDVGCGRGDLAVLLARRGWAMSGVEPSQAACDVARRRGVDVRCGTLSSVALESGRYDAAVFRHSLEHTTEPVAALRSVAAALAPDGIVVITVPNFGGWQARRLRGRWYHLDVPRHRVHFTAGSLERALEAAGLSVVSLRTATSAVGLPASLQYRVFGRCLFPGGLGLRIASGLCAAALPLAIALDRAGGGGDLLHVIARRTA